MKAIIEATVHQDQHQGIGVWYEFECAWKVIAEYVHETAQDKGFWDNDRPNSKLIALLHSELSECLEALRDGNPVSFKIPPFSQAEEEMADLVIRAMDVAVANDWNLAGAIQAKTGYNETRPRKHGKLF